MPLVLKTPYEAEPAPKARVSYAYEPGVGELRLLGARISRRDLYPLLAPGTRDAPWHGLVSHLEEPHHEHHPKRRPPERDGRCGIHVLTGAHEILGKSMGRSVVREAWRDFKPVSHLWVAAEQLLLSQRPINDIQRMLDTHLAIVAAPQFLISIAEEWRQFGEAFRTRHKSSLLDPEESWAAPEDFDLTKSCPVIPPLDQDEIERLESYMAPAHY